MLKLSLPLSRELAMLVGAGDHHKERLDSVDGFSAIAAKVSAALRSALKRLHPDVNETRAPSRTNWRPAFLLRTVTLVDGSQAIGHLMQATIDGEAQYRRETQEEVQDRISGDAW